MTYFRQRHLVTLLVGLPEIAAHTVSLNASLGNSRSDPAVLKQRRPANRHTLAAQQVKMLCR